MSRLDLALLLLISIPVFGAEPEYPLLSADTSSPRSTLNSFMENCETAYNLLTTKGRDKADVRTRTEINEAIRNIKRCMDLSGVAEFRRDNSAKESAVALKEVLDRIELPKGKNIPDLKAMTNEDGSLIERWTIPNTEITFQLVKEGSLDDSYEFSSDTVGVPGNSSSA